VESNLSKEKLIELYRKMFEIRSFEEKVFELYAQNLVPGTIHSEKTITSLVHIVDMDTA